MNRTTLLLMTLVALALPFAAVRADTIVLRGQSISGVKVKSESAVEVKYVKGSAKKTKSVPASDVLAVIYDNPPRDYRVGLEYFNLGDFVNAMTRLGLAADAAADPAAPWVKEYANYYLGRTYQATGQFEKGAKAFAKVLSANANSRFLGPATLGRARCLIASKSYSEAESALKKLKSTVQANPKIGGLWAQEADLCLGECFIAAAKYDQAVDVIKSAINSVQATAARNPLEHELVIRGKRLTVDAHIAAGELNKAQLVIKDLRSLGVKGDPHALAASRTARAAVALHESKETEELLRAAGELSRAHVENFAVVSELPRTCYLLGLVHLRLAGTLDNAKELAKGYFEEARRRFPETREALLAREQLKQL